VYYRYPQQAFLAPSLYATRFSPVDRHQALEYMTLKTKDVFKIMYDEFQPLPQNWHLYSL
jgi:hypothetical protein